MAIKHYAQTYLIIRKWINRRVRKVRCLSLLFSRHGMCVCVCVFLNAHTQTHTHQKRSPQGNNLRFYLNSWLTRFALENVLCFLPFALSCSCSLSFLSFSFYVLSFHFFSFLLEKWKKGEKGKKHFQAAITLINWSLSTLAMGLDALCSMLYVCWKWQWESQHFICAAAMTHLTCARAAIFLIYVCYVYIYLFIYV